MSDTIRKLQFVKEIHIIAVKNEVKEVLFYLKKGFSGSLEIKTLNIRSNTIQEFDFYHGAQAIATYSAPKDYIYEPNAAILKSGGFQEISIHLNIAKLQQHSHLYTSDQLIDFPGRVFKLKQVLSYNKKQLKMVLPASKANISTRNFPETVSQIRKKTGIKDGGNLYLFFTTSLKNKHIVLICEKI